MKASKKAKLEAAGWQVGTAEEFLGLSQAESEFIEMKLALAQRLRQFREKKGLSQAGFAKTVGSSQSRVAKMEAADATVTMDLLIKSLLVAGAKPAQVARFMIVKNSRSKGKYPARRSKPSVPKSGSAKKSPSIVS